MLILCLCVCVCMYVSVFVWAPVLSVCVRMWASAYVCMYVHACVCVFLCVSVFMYVCVYVCVPVCVCVCVCKSLLPAGRNACASQPCSLLCLPQPGQRHTCVCPEGAPTTLLPSGEVQCQCPTGYHLRNNTCVKSGERGTQCSGSKSEGCRFNSPSCACRSVPERDA